MHFYPHHIGDYRSHTAHLSNEEDLAYRRLLEMYYDTEQCIQDDIEWVARRLRVPCEAVQLVLRDFFQKTEAGWVHQRCEAEIAKYKGFAEAGKRGAEKRWHRDSPPIATLSPPQSWANAGLIPTKNQEPRTKNHSIPPKPPKGLERPEDVSDVVWEGFKKLRKAKKAPLTDTALQGIKREADKAGWSLEDALQECCVRGWQGFKADWVEPRTKGKPQDDALQKIKEDAVLSRPMPDKVRSMLTNVVKRMP